MNIDDPEPEARSRLVPGTGSELTPEQVHHLRRARDLLWTASEIETSWSGLCAAAGVASTHLRSAHKERIAHARELAQRCLDKAYAAGPGVFAARKPRLVGADHFPEPAEAEAYELGDPKRLGPHRLGWERR